MEPRKTATGGWGGVGVKNELSQDQHSKNETKEKQTSEIE